MKSFNSKILARLVLISIPALLWVGWQMALPHQQYTFRVWESVLSESSKLYGSFFPNQKISMKEVGDLAPYTENAVLHPVHWETDEQGYRNQAPVCDDPFGVVIGDSTAVGTSLDQPEIVSEQLSRQFGRCVRSFAGPHWDHDILNFARAGLHPRFVFMFAIERSAQHLSFPKTIEQGEQKNSDPLQWHAYQSVKAAWVHFNQHFYWNYRFAHGVWAALSRSFMNEDQRSSLIAPRSPTSPDPKMVFLPADENSEGLTDHQIEHSIQELNHFAEVLAKQGSQLIFSFVPNKTSIYYVSKGVPKPKFNDQFKRKLIAPKFIYVDLITRLQNRHAETGNLYHQLDDTHWNALGVREYVEEVVSAIPELRSTRN